MCVYVYIESILNQDRGADKRHLWQLVLLELKRHQVGLSSSMEAPSVSGACFGFASAVWQGSDSAEPWEQVGGYGI